MALMVISSYGMPSAVKLQIANLRIYNGFVEILVVDDFSPLSKEVRKVCDDQGVTYYPIPCRLGHGMGAKQSYLLGMIVAKSLWPTSPPNICCISQRFMVIRPKWVEEGEKLMGNKSVIYGLDKYEDGSTVARTECIIFNTNKWIENNHDKHFYGKNIGTVEQHLGRIIDQHIAPDDKVQWPMLGKNRLDLDCTDWFSHHRCKRDKYENLAEKINVKLKQDFHCESFYSMENRFYKG